MSQSISANELPRVLRLAIVTKTFSDFSTAGLTNDLEILSLPAGGVIRDCYARVTTGFSGGTIATYTISAGIAGSVLKYMIANSAAAAASLIANGTKGTALTTIQTNVESFTAATSIRAYATSTVDTLNHATQGSITFYIAYHDIT